ncbi:hypothetical protein [Streptomyces justiciae]|uniref:hypothetical protein n=1 Tax=Streptomyces justiciae TaxID=2780140 RepID=UPI001882061C|nr:hypothetical protein [Streptomyces justiciae]MBE8469511.1 hypothetical protein [Streptomyces justiciae]MCW8383834.1 hypothetical protein [Streptomyces justiciae]
MRIGVTEHRVRLGAEEYRVLRVGGLRRALCYDSEHWLSLWVDRGAAAELAAAWLLAARSPRSLVHLPLRRRAERPVDAALPEPHRARDLLLLHHSLQFPASRWKEVRARAGKAGRQHTVEFRRADFPLPHDQVVPGAHHAGFRDRLGLSSAADTLVLSGSALPFADAAADFFDLADTGPHQDGHVCAELHPGSGLLDRSMPLMHVEYRAEWEPVPRDG